MKVESSSSGKEQQQACQGQPNSRFRHATRDGRCSCRRGIAGVFVISEPHESDAQWIGGDPHLNSLFCCCFYFLWWTRSEWWRRANCPKQSKRAAAPTAEKAKERERKHSKAKNWTDNDSSKSCDENSVSTYDLHAPFAASDAPPVRLTHSVGCISFVGKPNECKARRVTRDPYLRKTRKKMRKKDKKAKRQKEGKKQVPGTTSEKKRSAPCDFSVVGKEGKTKATREAGQERPNTGDGQGSRGRGGGGR